MMPTTILTSWLLAVMVVGMVRGHGMVIDPPQRSSMWRYGYRGSPVNYNDNQLYCGGFARQWKANGGKCGVCGDPYNEPQPRPNEAGGRYATGVIVKTYRQAQVIDVAVKITANHLGYFLFKLCPNNNVKKAVTQECLDQHVLRFVGPNGEDVGTKFYIDNKVDTKYVRLQLPADITCTQCVLQWTYNTGNSWDCDTEPTRKCCLGCGPQENFINCVDIAITADGNTHTDNNNNNNNSNNNTPVTAKPKVTDSPVTAQPVIPQQTTAAVSVVGQGRGCVAAGVFAGNSQMDQWCSINCQRRFCPISYCICS